MTQNTVSTGEQLLPLFPENATVDAHGVLAVGGCAVDELAERYGTPLYIVDEEGMRAQGRRFLHGLRDRWPRSRVLFASKSLPVVAVYRLFAEEGLGVDVAGAGELRMALAAGVDPASIYLHGSAKTDAELRLALESGVGTIVVDNLDDVERIERFKAVAQRVLVRLIPGVAPETHASQSTGSESSKFGLPFEQALEAIARMNRSAAFEVAGVHLHIGSQVLATEPFAQAVAAVATTGGFDQYDVGGGLGVRYTLDDDAPSVDRYLDAVVAAARRHLPSDAELVIEPGRSLVGRAVTLLYRVSTVKHTARTFVAVDGGMSDLLDAALTQQPYEIANARRMRASCTDLVDVVGRQCESGDLLVRNAALPTPRPGDLLAVPAAGAYSFTFANNYNGALRPAVVFCAEGESRVVVRRQTYEELLAPHLP
ncbi:diaminopimelate decarboxylase [Microbacterium saperdae]